MFSYPLTHLPPVLPSIPLRKSHALMSTCVNIDQKLVIMSDEPEQVDMTLDEFKMMSVEALRVFLRLRNKSPEGDFETLVYLPVKLK